MKKRLEKIKEFSQSLTGKTVITVAIISLIIASFVPVWKAFANAPVDESNYAKIDVHGSTAMDNVDDGTTVTATYEHGSMTISGEGLYSDGSNLVFVPDGSDVTISLTPEQNYEGTIMADGDDKGTTTSFENVSSSDNFRIVEALFEPARSHANLMVCGENHHEAAFTVNNDDNKRDWYQPAPEDQIPGQNCSEFTINYEGNVDDEKVTIGFSTLWHQKFVGQIRINNTNYDIPMDYDDQTSWFQHYSEQTVIFRLEVPKAANDTYDIDLEVGENDKRYIGNFLWTADPGQEFEVQRDEQGRLMRDENGEYIYRLDENGDRIQNYNYIGHSRIQLVAVSYVMGDNTYSCNIDTDLCTVESNLEDQGGMGCVISEGDCSIPYVEYDTDPTVEYDDGSLVVPAGARVTMRISPDYGYQVLNVNMSELSVSDDGVGEFTFTVPAGAAYFKADVVKMSDEVNTKTKLVVDGSIDLGENQTTLDHGTARLYVGDANLDDETIAGFQNAAGDFKVKTYLDISLYNITYKGTTDEAWEDRIRDLNEEATITLQLEEGVDGNEIVIVHQKHDGTYEVIPTVYDPVTNTITFKTTSFSNYAIAARTVNSPETGEFVASETGSTAQISGLVVMLVVVATTAILCYNYRHDSD